ncbi:EthD domain-containing protein [Streptomyces sp. NPDC005551]|uniref:EthD domain-containing protein n=1 Tax=Streptomyces sp. NPDC005551 TaxID=3364725 RepID=UPI003686A58E
MAGGGGAQAPCRGAGERLRVERVEAKQYIRRFVVSYPVPAPNCPEPDYDSVVETWFDSMDDLNALFFCENFLKTVDPDHKNFDDLNSFGSIICEEEVVVG